MKRDRLAEIAGLLAIVIAVVVVIGGAIVALADEESFSANAYFRDAALAGFVLAAACYALRSGWVGDRHVPPVETTYDPVRRP